MKKSFLNIVLSIICILFLGFNLLYSSEINKKNDKEYDEIITEYITNQNTNERKVVSVKEIHYKFRVAKPVILTSINHSSNLDENKPICKVVYNSELKFNFNNLQINEIVVYDIMGNTVNKFKIKGDAEYFTTDISNLLPGPYFAKLTNIEDKIYILKFIK